MPRSLPRYLHLPAVAAAAVLVLAGCGGIAGTGAGGLGTGARAIPAHALLYVDVNLDHSSAAWRNAEIMGSRFPGWQSFLHRFESRLNAGTGGERLAGVEPWLGKEAAFAVTGVDVSNHTTPVDIAMYVAVSDQQKAEAWLVADHGARAGSYQGFAVYRSSDSHTLAAVGQGALLVSNDAATLHRSVDAWSGHAARLSAQPAFQRAMATLPPNALVAVYADAAQLGRLLSLAQLAAPLAGAPAPNAARIAGLASTLRRVGSFTGALSADPGGVRLTMNVEPGPGQQLPAALAHPNGPPALIGEVPSDAFAYLGGVADGSRLDLGGSGATRAQLQAFQRATGLSITRDLLPLLSGGIAAYASPGTPVDVAMLLRPANPKAAAAAMTRITAALVRNQPGLHVRRLSGRVGEAVTLAGMTIGWHETGRVLAISNDPRAGSGRSPSLAESSTFANLLRAAHVPAATSSIAYLDIDRLLAGFPVDPNLEARVSHIGGLVMWSSTDGAGAHFGAYLQIR